MASHESPHTDVTLSQPTRARFITLSFLCSMAFVLYLDRVCIAQALKPMKDEFDLTNTHMGLVSIAFTVAYGLFEIPTGRWGDRYGSRRVLTRIVLWWSVFTALTGCVWKFSYEIDFLLFPVTISTLVLLIAIRFLFGAGEAGAVPNAARIIKQWFPLAERGRTQGWFQAAMHVGGAIAPIVAGWIIDSQVGWRGAFVLFGSVGVVWAGAFYWWFRDKPGEHPAVNRAEIQLIGVTEAGGHTHGAIPWGDVLRHPNIWLLSVIITMTAFNSYLFFTWYPTYLQEAREWNGAKVTNDVAKWLAALALTGATAGSLLGGYLADVITRHAVDRYRARRRLCLVSFVVAAACLFGSVLIDDTLMAAVLCALACTFMFCPLPTWWAVTFDVAGKHPGALFGLLNSAGVFGAVGSQMFFGVFADWRKAGGFEGRAQWDPAFYVPAALLVVAAILWQFVRDRPAVGEHPPSADKP
jgi:ACS family glucarate transporter-like MFS transporter